MKTRKVISFFIITYLWAWVLWLPFVLPFFGLYEMTETLEGLVMIALMLGAFGPLAAALILTYREGGFRAIKTFFKRCFNFRIKPIYYVIAVALALGITAIAHYLTNILGIDTLPDSLIPSEISIPIYLLIVPYMIMMFLVGGGQEEFGWRGYAQDPLQDRFGIIKGSLILGLLWGLWHSPLWLIPNEGHSYYSLIAFLVFTTSWSLVIGIIYNLSGKKVVIPWIMHAINNLSVPLFPVLFLADVPQPGYWIWVGLNTITAIILVYWYQHKQKEVVEATSLDDRTIQFSGSS